jgi:hypothetical protein
VPRAFGIKDAHALFAVAARRSVLPIAAGAVEAGGSKSSCSIINVGAGGGVRAVAASWSLGPNVNDLLREINDTGKAKCPGSFSSCSLNSSVMPNRSGEGIGCVGGERRGKRSSGRGNLIPVLSSGVSTTLATVWVD